MGPADTMTALSTALASGPRGSFSMRQSQRGELALKYSMSVVACFQSAVDGGLAGVVTGAAIAADVDGSAA